jgi:hypothetical protein
VISEVTPRLKRYLRRLAFQLTAFKVLFGNRFPTLEILLGEEIYTARFAIIANGQYYGGDYRVSGPGLLTSGEFETILVERLSDLLRPDVFAGIMTRRPLNRAMTSFTHVLPHRTRRPERSPVGEAFQHARALRPSLVGTSAFQLFVFRYGRSSLLWPRVPL